MIISIDVQTVAESSLGASVISISPPSTDTTITSTEKTSPATEDTEAPTGNKIVDVPIATFGTPGTPPPRPQNSSSDD